ncbi:Hypothetical protein MSYG_3032 [Malassezia sympodialis ATCC 42132]|uniref:Uncharacterized protein n=1 Tax=Malassezia sympodialis (strain ATCC 42132) TaxID=1230383 RepID=A0A1M8A865_MALS4|nr:Hypothetical protein MSYG_3032 [Malassezia sympodialis ATCC 42132]
MFAGAAVPSPLELAIARLQARRTMRSFALIVGVLHFTPYLFHYVRALLRPAM